MDLNVQVDIGLDEGHTGRFFLHESSTEELVADLDAYNMAVKMFSTCKINFVIPCCILGVLAAVTLVTVFSFEGVAKVKKLVKKSKEKM